MGQESCIAGIHRSDSYMPVFGQQIGYLTGSQSDPRSNPDLSEVQKGRASGGRVGGNA